MNFPLLDIQGAVGAANKIGSIPSPWDKRLATPYKLHRLSNVCTYKVDNSL